YAVQITGAGENAAWTSIPLLAPGYGYAAPDPFTSLYTYRDQPVTYENDAYSGDIAVTDADDPTSSLTRTVVYQGHHGRASVDGSGHYTYALADGGGGNDAFVVQVSDSNGRADQIQIDVALPPAPIGPIGGIAPVVLDLNGSGFAFEYADDSNVFFANA